jgi:hypothetical protein
MFGRTLLSGDGKDRYRAAFHGIFLVAGHTGEGVDARFADAGERAHAFLAEAMQIRKKSLELADPGRGACC